MLFLMEKSNKAVWRCCKTDVPETGKKVLCHRKGDIYVAMRMKNYYIPIPFADHRFATDLSQPDLWSEISFPGALTGKNRVIIEGGDPITFSEMEVDYPEEFCKIVARMISMLGKEE